MEASTSQVKRKNRAYAGWTIICLLDEGPAYTLRVGDSHGHQTPRRYGEKKAEDSK